MTYYSYYLLPRLDNPKGLDDPVYDLLPQFMIYCLQKQTMTDKEPNLRKSTPLNVFRVLTSREGLMPKSFRKL